MNGNQTKVTIYTLYLVPLPSFCPFSGPLDRLKPSGPQKPMGKSTKDSVYRVVPFYFFHTTFLYFSSEKIFFFTCTLFNLEKKQKQNKQMNKYHTVYILKLLMTNI